MRRMEPTTTQVAPRSGSRASALASLHFAVLLFGFAALFGKWIALPPATIVVGRTVSAAGALAVLLALRGLRCKPFEWRLAGNGVLLALHWVAFFQAVQTASVAIALLGYASFPLFVLVLEVIFAGRRTRAGEWICAGVVTAGLVLLVPTLDFDNRLARGVAWGVLSGFTFALLAISNRALAARRSAAEIALWQNFCAAACLVPAIALEPAVPNLTDIAQLIVLGIVCTALAHTLFIASLRSVSAHAASVVAALEPVYGMALAALLLKEIPDARTLAGAALIVGATLWTSARAGCRS